MTRASRTIDVEALVDRGKMSGLNYRIIALSWLITFFDGLDMMMVNFAAPYMRDDLGLSKVMLGNMFSAGTVGMVLGGFAFSYLGDRMGRRPTILCATLMFGVLTILTGFAGTYEQLILLRLANGVAIGGLLPLAWALNMEFVPSRRRATVVTVIMIGFSVGGAAAGPLTNLLAPSHGWQSVYLVGGAGTLVCTAGLVVGLPESIHFLVIKHRHAAVAAMLRRLQPDLDVQPGDDFLLGSERSHHVPVNVRALFEGPLKLITPLLWLGYGASSMAIYFLSSWGPILLEELRIPRSTAASVSALGGLAGAAAALFLARFTDRYGVAVAGIYPALVIPVLLLVGSGLAMPVMLVPLVVVTVVLISGGHAAMVSIAGLFYPSSIRASGAGWVASIGKLGGVFGPVIGAQILSSDIPVVRTYALLAVCPALVCLCVGYIGYSGRRGRRDHAVAALAR